MESHSLPVGNERKGDETAFHKMWNVTHLLLVIGKKYDETAFHKMCCVTHSLLITGKDVETIFHKMSLTRC